MEEEIIKTIWYRSKDRVGPGVNIYAITAKFCTASYITYAEVIRLLEKLQLSLGEQSPLRDIFHGYKVYEIEIVAKALVYYYDLLFSHEGDDSETSVFLLEVMSPQPTLLSSCAQCIS